MKLFVNYMVHELWMWRENVDVTWPKGGSMFLHPYPSRFQYPYPLNDTTLTNCAARSGNDVQAKCPCHGTPGNWRERSMWWPGSTSGHRRDICHFKKAGWQLWTPGNWWEWNVWWSRRIGRTFGCCQDTCHFEKAGRLWLWPGVGPIPVGIGRSGQFWGLAPGRGARLHHWDSFFLQVLWRADITMDAAPHVRVQVWISRRKVKICKKMPWLAPESPKQKIWVLFQTHNQILSEHVCYSGSHWEGSQSWNRNTKSHSHSHIMWGPGKNQDHAAAKDRSEGDCMYLTLFRRFIWSVFQF